VLLILSPCSHINTLYTVHCERLGKGREICIAPNRK